MKSNGERTASEPQDRVTELIEQRTAISELLRAIASSPHDLQPVFDGERLHLFAAQRNYPDYLIVFEQRHKQGRSKTCVHHPDPKIIPKIAFKCCQVGEVGGWVTCLWLIDPVSSPFLRALGVMTAPD